MPDLAFLAVGASPVKWAASPGLVVHLKIENRASDEAVFGILLQCQVRIEVRERLYSAPEEGRLLELFGDRSQWHRTLRSLLWANASASVPAFSKETSVDLSLPCTFDFALGAAKYFSALE